MLIYDAIEYLADTTGLIQFNCGDLLVADSSQWLIDRYDNNFCNQVAKLAGQRPGQRESVPMFYRFAANDGVIAFFRVPSNKPVTGEKWVQALIGDNVTTFQYKGFDDFRERIMLC